MAIASAKTLKEFIESYLENKRISEKGESYEKWLTKRSPSRELEYGDRLQALATGKARGLSTYGKAAEKLSDMGLTGSGYADFISSVAKKSERDGKISAQADFISSSAKDMDSYKSYISALERENRKMYDSTVKSIVDLGYLDFTAAYELAIGNGIDEKAAREAAQSATDTVKGRLKSKVLHAIVENTLTESETYEYAISLGLSAEIAKALALQAKKINEYIPDEGAPIIGASGGGKKGFTQKALTD